MKPDELVELWFGACHVGTVTDAFCSQNTWEGAFRPVLSNCSDEVRSRMQAYIKFCENWHIRLAENDADASEFDAFQEVVKTNDWRMVRAEGISEVIAEAPVFFEDGDVSWRMVESKSS